MASVLALKIEDVTENVKTIVVSDISRYDVGLNTNTAILRVRAPYVATYKALPFTALSKVISFDSIQLGVSTVIEDIPDGIYKFEYSIPGVVLTMHHFRIAKLESMILHRIADLLEIDCDEYTIAMQAYLFMRCIKPLVADGNIKDALDFYNRATFIMNSVHMNIFK